MFNFVERPHFLSSYFASLSILSNKSQWIRHGGISSSISAEICQSMSNEIDGVRIPRALRDLLLWHCDLVKSGFLMKDVTILDNLNFPYFMYVTLRQDFDGCSSNLKTQFRLQTG